MKLALMTIFFSLNIHSINCHFAITYTTDCGRLGDQLTSYCIAKNISLKHTIDFYRRPFRNEKLKYYQRLKLSTTDEEYDADKFKDYTVVEIGHELPHIENKDKNVLFIVTNKHWLFSENDREKFGIPQDQKEVFSKLIAPIDNLELIGIPENTISVAVHIRTGQAYDQIDLIQSYSAKFPNEKFYIDNINLIKKTYSHDKLYIFLFSDAINPEFYKNKFNNYFNDELITFDSRKKSSPDMFVLEDMLSMVHFDILIRPHSTFSAIAQALGKHALILHAQ